MTNPSGYILGRSHHERERLMLQGRIMRPYTERYFRAAGIGPAMKVLDVGSGVGDVALLAGDLVGPGGRVVGLDLDPLALERARQRTVEQGCSSWVTFQETRLEHFSTQTPFDALVGRYVLMYQANPAETLRNLLTQLKPGGIVVFHELDFSARIPSFPRCELYDAVASMIPEAFARSGAIIDMGRRLGSVFVDAGLPFPNVVGDMLVGGAPGSLVFPLVASTVLSLAPRLADVGMSLPPGVVAEHGLAGVLENAAAAQGSQITGTAQFGAWTRKP